MSAMESSTKNAKEMLGSLTLLYNRSHIRSMPSLETMRPNRSRQATITKELIEIISGASALEEKSD